MTSVLGLHAEGLLVAPEPRGFSWRSDQADPNFLWVAPPKWLQQPAGFRAPRGWLPVDAGLPILGWNFQRNADGSDTDDELDADLLRRSRELFESVGVDVRRQFYEENQRDACAANRIFMAQSASSIPRSRYGFRLSAGLISNEPHLLDTLTRAAENCVMAVAAFPGEFVELCCWQDLRRWLLRVQHDPTLELAESRLAAGGFPHLPPPELTTDEGRAAALRRWRFMLAWQRAQLEGGRPDSDDGEGETAERVERLTGWVEAVVSGTLPAHRTPLAARQSREQRNWQDAEELAARVLRKIGWPDATTTGAGSDGGLDVLGRYVAAQVKYTSVPVGRPVLQRLLGASRGREIGCFARSGYTDQARTFADAEGIALFTLELPNDVSAVNQVSRSWLMHAS